MTVAADIAAAIHLAIVLLVLWALFFRMWPRLRLDTFRERLFALRGELFMYAAEQVERGSLTFDHPAYTRLRTTINGMIRFAHRVTLPRLVLAVIELHLHPDHVARHSFKGWRDAVEKLPDPEIRDALFRFHHRMFQVMARYLIAISPVLLLLSAFYLAKVFITGAVRRFWDKLPRRLHLELLEDQALVALEEDEHRMLHAV